MLIRFFVNNFLSFNSQTEFSMVAGQGATHTHHVVKGQKRHIPNVLRAGLLYGANGSGKSNFVKAISFAQYLIGGHELKELNFQYFKLKKENAQKPTSFQFDILLNDTIYSYGFEILNHQIKEEYLLERGATKDKTIFERKNDDKGKTQMSFDIHFKTKKQADFLEFIGMGTPKSRLFLAECRLRNVWNEVENLKEVENLFNWFAVNLIVIFPDLAPHVKHIEEKQYLEILHYFGTSITNFEWQPIDFEEIENKIKYDFNSLASGQNILIKSINKKDIYLFKKENNNLYTYQLATQHEGSDAIFEFSEESDGTKRLFDFVPIAVVKKNYTFIIDEIYRSLHPHLSKALLSYFLEHQKDTQSQFIATTHEASLLDLDLLRKDEIWFAEKNQQGETALYSLEEFKPRTDTEIRKGYLQGRFGAIPFIQNFANQKW